MTTSQWVSAAVVLGVVAAWISILSGEPRLAVESADGSYYNDCCDPIVLHGGQLRSGNEAVSYVIEQDKAGPYVLPKALVTVADDKLDIDRSAYPLKLRLDRQRGPTSITIAGRSGSLAHSFIRSPVR